MTASLDLRLVTSHGRSIQESQSNPFQLVRMQRSLPPHVGAHAEAVVTAPLGI